MWSVKTTKSNEIKIVTILIEDLAKKKNFKNMNDTI